MCCRDASLHSCFSDDLLVCTQMAEISVESDINALVSVLTAETATDVITAVLTADSVGSIQRHTSDARQLGLIYTVESSYWYIRIMRAPVDVNYMYENDYGMDVGKLHFGLHRKHLSAVGLVMNAKVETYLGTLVLSPTDPLLLKKLTKECTLKQVLYTLKAPCPRYWSKSDGIATTITRHSNKPFQKGIDFLRKMISHERH